MIDLGYKVLLSDIGYFGLEVSDSYTASDFAAPFDKNFTINPYFRLAPSLRKFLLTERPPHHSCFGKA